MTAITRYPGTNWDAALPLIPKPALALNFAVNHEYDASRIEATAGAAITSWADMRGSNPLINAVGGVLGSDAGSKYVQFSGVSGSLSVTLPISTAQTMLILARVNVGDKIAGLGPIMTLDNETVVQAEEDTAKMKVATSTPLPAQRGKWHMYAVSVPPTTGNALLAVDGATTEFSPIKRAFVSYQLSVGGSDRRQLQVAYMLTSPDALSAPQLADAYRTLKAHFTELNIA